MKIEVTQQQRDNALDALNVMWPSVPPENVAPGLRYWRERNVKKRPDCGTIACFGGWCAWWPNFRKQGVRVGRDGAPTGLGDGFASDVSQKLFGTYAMFTSEGYPLTDDDFKGSAHDLVTHRLKWLIENSVVVEPNKPRKAASGS